MVICLLEIHEVEEEERRCVKFLFLLVCMHAKVCGTFPYTWCSFLPWAPEEDEEGMLQEGRRHARRDPSLLEARGLGAF